MQQDLISIIVPVYNVYMYLDRCISSLVKQTYSHIEIILVNDGSTDDSGKICQKWAEKDNRIRVINKANGGLSDARNTGIIASNGRYIGFVDSDDYVKENMYEMLINLIRKYDADISRCGYVDIYGGRILNESGVPYKEYSLNADEFYIESVSGKNGNCVGVCNKLYKREIFGSICFKKGMYVEDYYFLPELINNISKAACTTMPGYCYVHRINGITSGMTNPEKQIKDRLDGCRHNEELLAGKDGKVKKAVLDKNLSKYFVCCRIANVKGVNNPKLITRLSQELRKNYRTILNSRILGRGFKRSYIFWFFFPDMYYHIFSKIEKKRYGVR